ncbi:MAG TPA: enoyl-CoA hydratase-related protein [Longimicrobium sp.]|nr:enoyl-CoA hydratase-related protein [Longimicrobium sp.]
MIERETENGIVTLRLAHGKANALDVELLEALIAELNAAADARAVIVTASGSIFSAGVDLFRLLDGGEAYVRGFFPLLSEFARVMVAFPAPLVVAANGHAIAGGGVMVLGGDYRLMAEGNGRLGVPELLVGVPMPAAVLELVRAAVPADRINPLMYLGRTYPPAEALVRGLVDEVVPADALATRAREVAEQLTSVSPQAFRLTKRSLRAPVLERIERSAAHDEEALALWISPDTHARIRDYLARTVRK